MIQVNLLPDVKLDYLKAERTRSLVISTAILVTAASIGLLILMIVVGGLQKKHINDLTKDIRSQTAELKKEKDAVKILTVQNQLNSLTALHSTKPAAAHVFEYLNSTTPGTVKITNFSIDFTTQTVTITGSADSLSSVNKYVDTLKYTKFTSEDGTETKPAFSNVVLTSFGVSSEAKPGEAANYTITFSYDPEIYDITKKVKLVVPTAVTTHAVLNNSDDLFSKGNN